MRTSGREERSRGKSPTPPVRRSLGASYDLSVRKRNRDERSRSRSRSRGRSPPPPAKRFLEASYPFRLKKEE